MTADEKPARPRKVAGNKGFAIAPRPGVGQAVEPEPAPAALDVPRHDPVSDFASTLASSPRTGQNGQRGTGMTVPIAAMVETQRDPEFDREALNTRQRRDVIATLDWLSRMSRRPIRDLVGDALMAYLRDNHAAVFAEIHHTLYPSEDDR